MKPLFSDSKTASAVGTSPISATFAFPASAGALQPVSAGRLPSITLNEDEIARLGEQSTTGLATLSSKMLGSVRTADADDFGTSLNQLVVTAKGLNPADMAGKGLLSRARSLFSSTKERLLAQYNTVEKQIDSLVTELEKKAELHRRRITDMEQLYVANMNYHQGLEQAVAQGEATLAQIKQNLAAAGQANDAFSAQQIADHQRLADRLEKRIDDLKRAMMLSKQTAPQIRLLQDNAHGLVQKFADVKAVTLPAWKNAFTLYLLHEEQTKAVAVLNAVDDATDEALRKGADLLRQNTEAIAKSRQRSVVSIETLEHVQRQLIGAFDDMTRINDEARAQRKASEPKLLALEQELITKFAPGQR